MTNALVPVESSAISHVGYDADTKTMVVRWHHGAETRYAGVPPHTHAALMRAKSVGSFAKRNVVGKFKELK